MAVELQREGHRIGDRKIAGLLHQMRYSLQGNAKPMEGAQHPDRNAQLEHINAQSNAFLRQGLPVISVDTKKRVCCRSTKGVHYELNRTVLLRER